MAQYIFDGQVNYGWGLTLDMTGKAPEVSKRIFDTYDNMLYYVNDYNDSCIPGLTLTVMNDGNKNGVYFVSKIGTEGANKAFNNDGVVVKQGTNSGVSDVNTALSNEIAARKAVDGQSGQTYSANSTASIISNATSLNDADIKLNNAITAETKARQDAIDAMNSTIAKSNGNFDISVNQVNGLLESLTISNITLSSGYTSVSYPEIDTVSFIAAKKGDTLDATIKNLDQNVATLVQETLDNEEVIAAAFTEIKESVGLDSNLKYIVDNSASYIKDATSFSEADSILDNALATEVAAINQALTVLSGLSANDLSNEIAARKAVDGQSGDTYTANSSATHISGATSLNDADIKLSNAITAETRARESLNEKIITAVGLNSDGTFKKPTAVQTSGYTTAATSVLDAIIILDNQVEENETVTAYALTDLNNRLLYYEGHNSISSLVSVPTTKRLCIATISSSQTLALNGTISDGRELHIIINNTNTSDVTITIPNTILNLVGENLTISGNSYGEINLTSDGTNIYYRGAGA